jgi:hypothetical protein
MTGNSIIFTWADRLLQKQRGHSITSNSCHAGNVNNQAAAGAQATILQWRLHTCTACWQHRVAHTNNPAQPWARQPLYPCITCFTKQRGLFLWCLIKTRLLSMCCSVCNSAASQTCRETGCQTHRLGRVGSSLNHQRNRQATNSSITKLSGCIELHLHSGEAACWQRTY